MNTLEPRTSSRLNFIYICKPFKCAGLFHLESSKKIAKKFDPQTQSLAWLSTRGNHELREDAIPEGMMGLVNAYRNGLAIIGKSAQLKVSGTCESKALSKTVNKLHARPNRNKFRQKSKKAWFKRDTYADK